MSPFQKNFQRLLIFFFAGVSIILIFLGVNRSKGGLQQATTGKEPASTSSPSNTFPSGAVVFTGGKYQTPWGNAVASISVVNGKITGVTMPQVPQSPPSIYAEPYLVAQALASGSANIQGVSGATYTSIAFKSSLESAIAAANAQGQNIIPLKTTVTSPRLSPSVPRSYLDDDY